MQAAEAATIAFATAEGDTARANQDIEKAEVDERLARDRFHDAEDKAMRTGGA
jgi:hypothetical protein